MTEQITEKKEYDGSSADFLGEVASRVMAKTEQEDATFEKCMEELAANRNEKGNLLSSLGRLVRSSNPASMRYADGLDKATAGELRRGS